MEKRALASVPRWGSQRWTSGFWYWCSWVSRPRRITPQSWSDSELWIEKSEKHKEYVRKWHHANEGSEKAVGTLRAYTAWMRTYLVCSDRPALWWIRRYVFFLMLSVWVLDTHLCMLVSLVWPPMVFHILEMNIETRPGAAIKPCSKPLNEYVAGNETSFWPQHSWPLSQYRTFRGQVEAPASLLPIGLKEFNRQCNTLWPPRPCW